MKTRIKNTAVLDMRKATEEAVEQIESVRNVAVVLVSPQTRALAARMDIRNMAAMIEVDERDEDVELMQVNGECRLSAFPQKSVFLMANGVLRIDPKLDAQEIARSLRGGIVNGEMWGAGAQLDAMLGAGVHVNGEMVVIPQGFVLREGKGPLTVAEARGMEASAFLAGRTVIEAGVCRVLADKGLQLGGKHAVFVPEAEQALFYTLWQGRGRVVVIPEGYRLLTGDQVVGRRDIIRLRGKCMVDGTLCLREDVDEGALAAIEGLRVTGALVMPEAVMLAVVDRLQNDPELLPYTGELVQLNGQFAIGEEGLAQMPQRMAILADGVLSIDPKLDPSLLRQRITLFNNDGMLELTQAQHMALLPVITGDGHINILSDEPTPEKEAEDAEPVHIVGNAALYIL